MTHDDPLAQRLAADADAWRAGPSPHLRARTLVAIADERVSRAAFARRAASIAAAVALATAVTWFAVAHTAVEPVEPPTPWVVATIDEQPALAEPAPRSEPLAASAPSLDLPERLPWIGAGDGPQSWTRVMFHPFQDEWTRMKADAVRAGDVLGSRLARPLSALLLRTRR